MPNACPSEAHERTAARTDWRQWYACMTRSLVLEEVINTRHIIMFRLGLIHIGYAGVGWDKFSCFSD